MKRIIHIFQPRGGGVHLVSNLTEVNELLLPTSKVYPILKTSPIAQEYITDVLTLAVCAYNFQFH